MDGGRSWEFTNMQFIAIAIEGEKDSAEGVEAIGLSRADGEAKVELGIGVEGNIHRRGYLGPRADNKDALALECGAI